LYAIRDSNPEPAENRTPTWLVLARLAEVASHLRKRGSGVARVLARSAGFCRWLAWR